jgi:copper resistance protein D
MSPRAWAGGASFVGAAAVAASAAAWSLAYPNAALEAALARAVADLAVVATLGLAVVPALDDGRHRRELAVRSEPMVIAASAAWLLAEIVRQSLVTAEAAAIPLARLPASAVWQLTLHTTPGRAGLVSIVAAAVVFSLALAGRWVGGSGPAAVTAVGVTALGIGARALSGHLADSVLGASAVALHALAAALWCGVLAALVLTVQHRGQWARVLPRFSRLSLLCVVALLATGVIGAVLVIASPAALFTSGYGRVLLAKVVLAALLVGVGWRNRTVWVPAAQSHRVSAGVSGRRALTELAVMVAALVFAATLVVTG